MAQPSPDHQNAPEPQVQQLVLQKRDQKWVFRYLPGNETDALHSIASTASDPTKDFDWFDAAVLSHQMGGEMHNQLKKLMTQNT